MRGTGSYFATCLCAVTSATPSNTFFLAAGMSLEPPAKNNWGKKIKKGFVGSFMLKRLRKCLLSHFLNPQSYLQNPNLSSVSVLNS